MARPIPLFVGDQLHVWKKEGKRRPPVSPWTNISVVFFTRKKGKYKSPVEADSRQRTTNGGRATGFLWAALSAPSPLRLLPICQRPRLLFLIEKTLIDAELSDLNERIP